MVTQRMFRSILEQWLAVEEAEEEAGPQESMARCSKRETALAQKV